MIGIDQAVRACFDQLVQLDRLGTVVEYEDWFLLFTQLLEQSTVPMATPRHAGVSVLDAMSSRGLSFRALFVLGMNEKVFPRFIHEDAFLRDRHRRVLDATLGYKIDEKLSGYDEEQLLFALLQRAAGARLYLLHQRADAEGRPLAPSPYLAGNVAVGTGGEHAPELRFPRRLSERQTMRRWGPLLVTPQEFRLTSIFQGQDPTPVVGALWAVADLFRSGCAALDHIEAEAGRLGDYDGITGSLPSHWDAITAHGVSPTSLQQYAQCPFRYFGTHVLGLKPVRQAVAEEPSVQELGTLAHAVLASSYRRLVDTGWPERDVGIDSLQKTVASSGEEIFSAFAARRCTGYALLWRMAQDTIRDMVLAAVAADTEDYHHHGFKPIAFEVEGRGTIAGLGLPGPDSLPIRGRVDRLDQRIDPPGIRVVDYKYRLGKNLQSSERDLATSAVRGRRLQPPLYAKLRLTVPADSRGAGTTELAQPERVELIYLVPRGERPVERSTFEARDWERPLGQRLQRTLQILLEGVHAGRYFILPGDYCTRCEFSPACRRYHTPTWRRAHQASEGGRLRRLRTERVPRDE